MAASSGDNRVSTFPLPPMQYVSQYTSERVSSGTAPPPPPPLDSNYAAFGVQCTKEDAVIHSLESQGLRRLYPPLYDHKRELKKLNFSILANYLDLIDIVIRCPDTPERAAKLEHMKMLFINMHHLINEYRPLQARDTLIEMLTHQASVTRQTVDTASRYLGRVDDIIAKATAELPSADALTDALLDADQLLAMIASGPAATVAASADSPSEDLNGEVEDEELEEENEEYYEDDDAEMLEAEAAAGERVANFEGRDGGGGGDSVESLLME